MAESLRIAEIVGRRQETPDIVALDLAASNASRLPDFTAGAHIDVELGTGLVRQYSLYSLPNAQGTYQIGVLKDPTSRGGSLAMHALRPGDAVRLSAPRNHFALTPGSHTTLLLGGGIGITPLLCMAEQLSVERAEFALHYCARSSTRAAFLDRLRKADYADRVALHFDDGPKAQLLDIDAVLRAAPADTHIYMCGPEGFMAWVGAAAERATWPAAQLHREYFKAGEIPTTSGERSFQIRLARSGQLFDVPADRSIVTVLHEHGIDLPTSCESGVCGTCLCSVLEGQPDHRDFYLTPEEKARGDQLLPCCSRALSPLLVLDV